METLLKNETVRMKIKSLSPQVRKSFIESLLDLYEQETEEMIDVIEESRMELRGDFLHITEETKSLRAESRMLEEKRKQYGNEDGRKTGMTSRNSDSRLSRLSYINEQENSKSLQDYRKRGKRRQLGVDDARSKSTDRPPDSRSVSVLSTRSLPTPVSSKTVEQEKEEVMKNLKTATHQNEVERQRQADLIAERREKRRQQKQTTEEKALELLEKALLMDKKLAEKKQEQDRKLKERLEERKKRKEKETAELVEIDFGDIDPRSVSRTDPRSVSSTEPRPVSSTEPRSVSRTEPRSVSRTDKRDNRVDSRADKQETRGDRNGPRPKSGADRHKTERENKTELNDKRESSRDRKKETKKDINSVYDFGDF